MAKAYVLSSDALLVTSRAKGSWSIPFSEEIEHLILGDQRLADRFWKLPRNADVVVLADIHQFFWK